jgi:antitoxin component YwqK of YwqJK toxin-antitoxin module
MKRLFILTLFMMGCHHQNPNEAMALIQIQDRNGITETISNPERLTPYESIDFLATQPYKKVLRVYKIDGKNRSVITTYHPNGLIYQYLEAEEMRAHGAYREWFSNGQLKIEANVVGGTADVTAGSQRDWIFESLSRVWDEQGNLIAQIPYQKGALEGTATYYYPTGQIEREITYARSNREGPSIEYYPTGELKEKTQYNKGMKEGESLGFFETGQLSWMEDYSEGLLRTGAYFNPQGDLIAQVEKGGGIHALWDHGALTLTEYRVGKPDGLVQQLTSTGELRKTYYLKNGKKQGEEIDYYPSSSLPKMSINWHENAIHGTVKTWYSHGQLQSQREFVRNQKTGPALAWYPDGALMLVEEYEEDRLIEGKYYKKLKREPVSLVTNGNGLATLFDETGAILRKIAYQKGKALDPEN